MDLSSLPSEILMQVFSNLEFQDLAHISQTSKRFHELSNLDSLWKPLCEFYYFSFSYPISEDDRLPWKSHFQNCYCSFRPYLSCYKDVALTWHKIEKALEFMTPRNYHRNHDIRALATPSGRLAWDRVLFHFRRYLDAYHSDAQEEEAEPLLPGAETDLDISKSILHTLKSGCSELEVDQLKTKLGHAYQGNLDVLREFFCSCRIRDGQKHRRKLGLFGSYSCYDVEINLHLLSSHEVSIPAAINPKILIFAVDLSSSKFLGIFLGNEGDNQILDRNGSPLKKGMVVCWSNRSMFKIADSFLTFLQTFANNLISQKYTIHLASGELDIHPISDIPTATTRGVTVSCSCIFCPELSQIPEDTQHSNYMYTYKISIMMSRDEDPSRSCVLVKRHWIISDDGEQDIVDGPGVIGLYPNMQPGTLFEYASRCNLRSKRGSMKGWFLMQNLLTKEEFQVEVPEFFMSPVIFI